MHACAPTHTFTFILSLLWGTPTRARGLTAGKWLEHRIVTCPLWCLFWPHWARGQWKFWSKRLAGSHFFAFWQEEKSQEGRSKGRNGVREISKGYSSPRGRKSSSWGSGHGTPKAVLIWSSFQPTLSLMVQECFTCVELTGPCDLAVVDTGSVGRQQLARAWCWSSMNRFWSCWQLHTQMACLFHSWLVPFTQKISTQISVCWTWQNVHHWWLGSYCCTHYRWCQTSVAVDGLR